MRKISWELHPVHTLWLLEAWSLLHVLFLVFPQAVPIPKGFGGNSCPRGGGQSLLYHPGLCSQADTWSAMGLTTASPGGISQGCLQPQGGLGRGNHPQTALRSSGPCLGAEISVVNISAVVGAASASGMPGYIQPAMCGSWDWSRCSGIFW